MARILNAAPRFAGGILHRPMGMSRTGGQGRGRIPAWSIDLGLSLALALFAVVPRLAGLSAQRLIDDACFHVEMARWPLGEIWDHCTTSLTMPGWFIPFKVWQATAAPLFSSPDMGARAFGLLAGCLTVTAVYWLGLLVAGRRVALLAGIGVALSGYQINFSQTATPYALLCLLGVLGTLTLVASLARGSRLAAVAHCLVMAGAFYCHHAAALLWGGHAAGLLLLLLTRAAPRRRIILAGAAAWAALLLALPAIALWWAQADVLARVGLPYVQEFTAEAVARDLFNLLAYRSMTPLAGVMVAAVASAALVVGLRAAVVIARGGGSGHHGLLLIACAAVLPPVVSLAAGLAVADYFWYAPRYFALIQAAWIVLWAVAVDRVAGAAILGSGRHVVAAVLLLAFLAPQAGSLMFLNGEARARETFPVDKVSAYLRNKSRPGDAALVHHSWYKLFFNRYFRQPHPVVMGAITDGIRGAEFGGTMVRTTQALVAQSLDRLASHPRIFLVLTTTKLAEDRDPDRLLERTMDAYMELQEERCFACDTGDPVRIKLYRRGGE